MTDAPTTAPKRIGRPPVAEEDRRKLRVRFSDNEWAIVCELAESAGLNPTEYTRRATLGTLEE